MPGQSIILRADGYVKINHYRLNGGALAANGLRVISPEVVVVKNNMDDLGITTIGPYPIGTEIILEHDGGGFSGDPHWFNTGDAVSESTYDEVNTWTFIWEDSNPGVPPADSTTVVTLLPTKGQYIPRNVVLSYRPVYGSTIGMTSVSRLNGIVADNGTGILAWVNHDTRTVHSAVLDPMLWLSNDAVLPSDVVTIADFSAHIYVYSVGVFAVGNTFYAIVHARRNGNLVDNDIYRSDDLGASWSYVSTYIAQGNPGGGHDGVFTSTPLSLPHIDGSKWTWTSSQVQQGPANADRVPRVTVVESTNGGLSVTTRLNTGAGRFSLFTEHISSQIVTDPLTGDLYISTGGSGSSIDSWYMYRSTDGGVSWPAVINFGNGSNYYIPFTSDGRYMYALRYYGGIYRMVNPLDRSTWQYVAASGGAAGHGRFHWLHGRAHFFNYGDQIWTGGGGWQVGSVAFG